MKYSLYHIEELLASGSHYNLTVDEYLAVRSDETLDTRIKQCWPHLRRDQVRAIEMHSNLTATD